MASTARKYLPGGKLSDAHELIQALALHENIGHSSSKKNLINLLLKNNLSTYSLSSIYYWVSPLIRHSAKARKWLKIDWKNLAKDDSKRSDKPLGNRSKGIWFRLYRKSLSWLERSSGLLLSMLPFGGRPLSPGFSKFSLGGFLSRHAECRGIIPTPFGKISITLRREGNSLCIDALGPKDCQPVLVPYPETSVSRALYNGKVASCDFSD